MSVLNMLAVMWSGAVMVLLGVTLGGFIVFRSKRPGEYILPAKEIPVTGATNVDALMDFMEEEPEEEEATGPLDIIAMEQNARFLEQLAKDKSEALDNE